MSFSTALADQATLAPGSVKSNFSTAKTVVTLHISTQLDVKMLVRVTRADLSEWTASATRATLRRRTRPAQVRVRIIVDPELFAPSGSNWATTSSLFSRCGFGITSLRITESNSCDNFLSRLLQILHVLPDLEQLSVSDVPFDELDSYDECFSSREESSTEECGCTCRVHTPPGPPPLRRLRTLDLGCPFRNWAYLIYYSTSSLEELTLRRSIYTDDPYLAPYANYLFGRLHPLRSVRSLHIEGRITDEKVLLEACTGLQTLTCVVEGEDKIPLRDVDIVLRYVKRPLQHLKIIIPAYHLYTPRGVVRLIHTDIPALRSLRTMDLVLEGYPRWDEDEEWVRGVSKLRKLCMQKRIAFMCRQADY
ncbi:hypothetical protein EXIGLDRAFT_771685 [Exidia glandulosa HHB12029]|uniref:Uncharacterized protein n=1 Tax=Exidia glandulosa HHB12029 TaxID=1314781 RepID=A0A165FT95_EXIGL|nr:hypothetical protein EXIGLDRAFT_771685 [Exidia glandulosa HHB12029]